MVIGLLILAAMAAFLFGVVGAFILLFLDCKVNEEDEEETNIE